jgi:hypothetical protein
MFINLFFILLLCSFIIILSKWSYFNKALAIIVAIICIFLLCGCSMTWGNHNNMGSVNFLTDAHQTYDERTQIRTVSQEVNIKALRTSVSGGTAVITGNPWFGVTGALPEAVDAGAEVMKTNFSKKEQPTTIIVPESIPQKSGKGNPIPAPK